MNRSELDKLSNLIIGAAIEVHRELGPGLLENIYEKALGCELSNQKIKFQSQVELPVYYKGVFLECGYRADMIVEDKIILELKSIESILPIHKAQLITYLKLSNKKLGFLINFNVNLLKQGIKRIVNKF